jgi:hypothetical protein
MNKNIIIIVIILAIIAVGVYFFTSKPLKAPNSLSSTAQSKTESKTQTMQGTLRSLLSSGKSQKCTYSNKIESASIEGTVYVVNGKMRGDFISGTEEKKVNGHMIVDGKNSYVWTDSSKQGIKMAYDPNEQTPSIVPANTNSQISDINKTFTYKCQGWAENNAVFSPPSDIAFSSFTIPSVSAPSGAETNPPACAACDNLPEGTAKNTCKTQLNCE